MITSVFFKTTVAAVALVVGVVGCASKKTERMDSVSGVLIKPDHLKLAPGAVAHVRLADVTKGHIKSETIVQKTVRPHEDDTIPFTLEFKESQIDPSRKYAVDVRVVDRNQVIVIGGKHHPVVTRGHPHTVEMNLARGSKL